VSTTPGEPEILERRTDISAHVPCTSVIIVSYNTRDLTLECLASLFEQTQHLSMEVLVVDNASEDGSAAAVRAAFPQLTLLAQDRNLGFGRAVNLAARSARGTYLLLLNPDTRILDAAVEKLVAFAEARQEAGLYGGLTLYPDGTLNRSSCWNRPTLWSAFCQGIGFSALFPSSPLLNPEPVRLGDEPEELEVDIISGGFLLIRRSLWTELGGFDPVFFMYGEDFDLSLRAAARGARPRVTLGARIIHHGGASERAQGDRLVRLLRSKAQVFERHWPPGRARAGKGMLALWALTRRLAYGALAAMRVESASAPAEAWAEAWRRRGEFLSP
jgi:GT2 family glycosyltransferase